MKISLLAVILFTLSINTYGQEFTGAMAEEIVAGSDRIIMKSGTTIPQLVKLKKGSEINLSSFESFLTSHYKSNLRFGIKLLTTETDQHGFVHYRYQQTLNGIPVEGTMYLVHSRNGKIEMMNGFFFDHAKPLTPQISETAALNSALSIMPAIIYRWQIPSEENMLKEESGNQNATWYPKGELLYTSPQGKMNAEDLKLCYRFDIYSLEPLARKFVYVDASTGEVIRFQNRIESFDAVGTAVTGFSGTVSITADNNGGTYRLHEAGRGNGIETWNLNHSTSNYAGATDFTDADNSWNNVNSNLDQYATDAHWGSENVYDFYQAFFGRNSIDGNGYKLKAYVHYGTNYFNAFWDGSRVSYGDGNGFPLVSVDICGHEFSHGLTEFTSNLTYAYESGALNESFSDCMGEAIEFWKKPADADWLVGEDVGTFRSMSDPKAYGNPDTYLGQYWEFGSSDDGGVHTNSGVQNHWFYIVSHGESGTNDNGTAYNVTGIGITTAQAILYRANTLYYTPSTDYSLARQYTIQAAIDLYGACSSQVAVVTNAWNAVGVGDPFVASVTASFYASPNIFCSAPAAVTFTNTSVNAGTFNWNFGDGTTSTSSNPTHTYQNYGVYTVKLVANGGTCGSDSITKNSYINVNSSNACSVNMPQTGNGTTQTACIGILYDSGGPNSNYQDNTSSTMTISPTGASSVQLSFNSFNLEDGYDFLYVYDGATTAAPLLGVFTGNFLPPLVISSGPSVTIKQTSDPFVNYSGYEVHWNCSNANTTPVAAFTADYTSTCSGAINFTDQSLNVPTSWLWNFGDGFTSTAKNPSHTYATSGNYSVSLTATNASGSNLLTKTNFISVTKSSGPTTTGGSVCTSGSVTLTASGSGTLNWYDAASGGNLIATGTSYTTPVLTTTTNYYVDATTSYAQQGVGPASRNIGSYSSFDNSTDRYLIFDCYAPVKLVSVRVYATGSGNRTLELRNSSNVILKSKTVNMIDGEQVITLNWDLPVANALHLGVGGPANMTRNTTGASYPYTLSGVVSITGNNAGLPDYYYWYYDWKLQQPTCITQRSTVTATVIKVTAVITPAGSTTICNGSSVVLNATSGAGLTYQWKLNGNIISGATANAYTATQAGDYTVVVTNNGCSSTSSAVTVTIISAPSVSITANGPTSFCKGGSVTLTCSPAGYTYQWMKNGKNIAGATQQSYVVKNTASYACNLTYTCGTLTSNTISATQNPVPAATIAPSGTVTICTGSSITLQANTGANLGYQWKKGSNNLSGETNSSYLATNKGTYKVVVTDVTTGCSKTSAGTKIVTQACKLTDSEENLSLLTVYPNPTPGDATITFNYSANDDHAVLQVKNLLGQPVYSSPLILLQGRNEFNIHLSDLPEGMYLLELETGGKKFTAKLIVER